ncbi:hypothetical protein Lalb_Chr12g0209641 [Lupinus albus]|uniref:Uncharacterized protein n=1 Tax=Lupinus albus TaxID=3870 RepID=A0A6A4PP18_LUPAL|nr:hypothetical protein Lalb_Chr12g0209641 [Lupinus albus]
MQFCISFSLISFYQIITKKSGDSVKGMAFMKGKALVTKVAAFAKYGVLPGAMVASLIYSPPRYSSSINKIPN